VVIVVLGFITTAWILVFRGAILLLVPEPIQWEIEVVKWQNEATVIEPGWEPFGFDKATNGIFVKRIKGGE
jgi:hypothetical protein